MKVFQHRRFSHYETSASISFKMAAASKKVYFSFLKNLKKMKRICLKKRTKRKGEKKEGREGERGGKRGDKASADNRKDTISTPQLDFKKTET